MVKGDDIQVLNECSELAKIINVSIRTTSKKNIDN